MPNFKFQRFLKGWNHRQQHLVGLDGFNSVRNFVVHANAIEKVRGWQKIQLQPEKYSDAIDTFIMPINNMNLLIDSLNDSFLNPQTLVNVEYPLVGPHVQAIFPYIKFEEELIRLGEFTFDYPGFFGLVPNFNYVIDFNDFPAEESGTTVIYNDDSYGMIYTCDKNCNFVSHETTVATDPIIAGVAVRIVAGSTKDSATFYGLIYDPVKQQLVFGLWVNHNVKTYHQILAVKNGVTYPPGTKLRITEGPTANRYKSFVNDVEQFDITDATIGFAGTCFGMVKLLNIVQTSKTVQTFSEGGTHTVGRFFYCNDGIQVINNLLPVPDTSGDPTTDLTSPFDVTVKSGFNGDKCYGFLRAQIWNNGFVVTPPAAKTDYYYFDLLYTRLSGHPRSGPAFRVDESKADPNDFTGWAVIIDGDWLHLTSWVNQSLRDYGTIRKSFKYTMQANEGLSVEYYTGEDEPSFSTISVYRITTAPAYNFLFTYANPEAIIPKGIQLSDRQANANIGIVWIGNDADELHTARFRNRKTLYPTVGGFIPEIYVE